MAALKLRLIQKYKLENAYTYVYSTGFLSGGSVLKQGADSTEEGNACMFRACPEQGASALLLTRREEAPGAYEYSGAAEPLFRKSGNRLSGIGNRHVA